MSVEVTWVVVADENRGYIFAVRRGMARLREVFELERTGEATDVGEELARRLEEAGADGCYDELVLVAAPAFLADLRDRLSHRTRGTVVAEIGKNLVGAGREVLQEQVLRVL